MIVRLLTRQQGLHAGLVRGQRARALAQPGTRVAARWRARLSEHLGTLSLESDRSPVAAVLDDPLRLAAIASACALVDGAAPERQVIPGVFEGLEALLDVVPGPVWDAAYVRWEVGLLAALGFGLDLERCAVTGNPGTPNDRLVWVSPRTGRAVSLSAGEPYRDRLLPLPGFLAGGPEAGPAAVDDGLRLTGHFLERMLFGQGHRPLPPARQRLVDRYRRAMAVDKGPAAGEASAAESPDT